MDYRKDLGGIRVLPSIGAIQVKGEVHASGFIAATIGIPGANYFLFRSSWRLPDFLVNNSISFLMVGHLLYADSRITKWGDIETEDSWPPLIMRISLRAAKRPSSRKG